MADRTPWKTIALTLFAGGSVGYGGSRLSASAQPVQTIDDARLCTIEGAAKDAKNAVEKITADHEARIRSDHDAIVGFQQDMRWVRSALRTGKDPETGERLPR